jgi:hypothetical protein
MVLGDWRSFSRRIGSGMSTTEVLRTQNRLVLERWSLLARRSGLKGVILTVRTLTHLESPPIAFPWLWMVLDVQAMADWSCAAVAVGMSGGLCEDSHGAVDGCASSEVTDRQHAVAFRLWVISEMQH